MNWIDVTCDTNTGHESHWLGVFHMFLCAEFMLKLTNGIIAGTAILRYEVYFEISIYHVNADTKSVQRWE